MSENSVRDEGDGAAALLGVGLYTVRESVDVIKYRLQHRVDNRLLLRWSRGRREFARDYRSIIGMPLEYAGAYLFNFSQLIELLTIAAFRSKGVSTATIRRAYDRAAKKYGDHPFAREGYRTDGRYIYTKPDDPESEELSMQQTFFEEVVKPILMDVSYIDGRAVRFSPLGIDRNVILDPQIAFGSPVDKSSGVSTAVLYAMREGGESDDAVAEWYGVSIEAVRDAYEFESAIRKMAA